MARSLLPGSCEIKRVVKAFRDAGLPVERMHLTVDRSGIHLLPIAADGLSDPDLDLEMAEWRARGNG